MYLYMTALTLLLFPKNTRGLLKARGKSICYKARLNIFKKYLSTVSVPPLDIFPNKIICTTQKGQIPKLDQNVQTKKRRTNVNDT